MDLVEAVEQSEDDLDAWRERPPALPIDHSAWFETVVPLLGVAFTFIATIARGLP